MVTRRLFPLAAMSVRRNQEGFTLLEALIAVLLMTFAFLSASSLHLTSARNAVLNSQQITASLLADEMVQRLRVVSALQLTSMVESSGATTSDCYTTTGCSAQQIAVDELARWRASINDRLGGGASPAVASGVICRDSTPDDGGNSGNACTGGTNDPIVIKVWWPIRADRYDPNRASESVQRFFVAYVPKDR